MTRTVRRGTTKPGTRRGPARVACDVLRLFLGAVPEIDRSCEGPGQMPPQPQRDYHPHGLPLHADQLKTIWQLKQQPSKVEARPYIRPLHRTSISLVTGLSARHFYSSNPSPAQEESYVEFEPSFPEVIISAFISPSIRPISEKPEYPAPLIPAFPLTPGANKYLDSRAHPKVYHCACARGKIEHQPHAGR